MTNGTILLVEDNPDDQALTLRALKKNNIANEVIVVDDGAKAARTSRSSRSTPTR